MVWCDTNYEVLFWVCDSNDRDDVKEKGVHKGIHETMDPDLEIRHFWNLPLSGSSALASKLIAFSLSSFLGLKQYK